MWSADLEYQHNLGVCETFTISGCTPALLNHTFQGEDEERVGKMSSAPLVESQEKGPERPVHKEVPAK